LTLIPQSLINTPPFPELRFHLAISRFDPCLPPPFADGQILAGILY
jgi:hypothetical protein